MGASDLGIHGIFQPSSRKQCAENVAGDERNDNVEVDNHHTEEENREGESCRKSGKDGKRNGNNR